MNSWKIYTPEGVQDILFDECSLKREIEGKVRQTLVSGGFLEIETPTLEFFDAFSENAELTPQENMFKFFDGQGRILVLRPDITIPVARLAATKLKDSPYPLRISYIGNSFRYNELGGGKQKEFTQAGAELLGVDSPEADAEVIALAINCLKAAGLENFQLDIGQVEFFKGLMEETGLSDSDTEQMRVLIDKKDFIGIEELVNSHGIEGELRSLILGLPSMFGSDDIIEKAGRIASNSRSLNALENLKQVLGILEDYGLRKYVSIDLGLVQSLTYYTGIIFKGFTHGVGFPVVSGGRYDRLVEKFGKDCPATGFSLGISMVMTALQRQNMIPEKKRKTTLISYSETGRKTAFMLCGELRRQGLDVEMDVQNLRGGELIRFAANKGISGIIIAGDDGNLELIDIDTGKRSNTSIEELLK